MACSFFGLECKVYMLKVSCRMLMETWGAQVVPSLSPDTQAGRAVLAQNPDSPGTLGIAISEAVEDTASREDTKYSLGSVLNHVLLHQTIIGLKAKKQLELAGDYPDVVIGCVGGGSNFAGLAFPFVADKLRGKDLRVIAVEPEACPSLTRGIYTYGLRYHGMAPLVSLLYENGIIEARAEHQTAVFRAAVEFARAEGIVPAPESAHAVKVAMDLALEAREAGRPQAILFNLSDRGHFDLAAYEQYLAGKLEDYAHLRERVKEALKGLPKVPVTGD